MTFDVASNIVLHLAKLLETMYDCSDVATFSMSPTLPDTLTVTTIDAFACSKHIATIPIIMREEHRNVKITFSSKKLAKSLKKTKNTAIRFKIVSDISLLVTPANNPDTIIYAEDDQYDFVTVQTDDNVLMSKSVPVSLLLADLSTMVINLCIGNGFVSFKTNSHQALLCIDTKTFSNCVSVEKNLQCNVPDFESIIVIKLLKVLTHSSLPSVKTVVCYIPTEENIPLKFCVVFSKCTFTTLLYDQTQYM
jgi:hypothetical protein